MKEFLYRCNSVRSNLSSCFSNIFIFFFFGLTLYLWSVCSVVFIVYVRCLIDGGKSCRAFGAEVQLQIKQLMKWEYWVNFSYSDYFIFFFNRICFRKFFLFLFFKPLIVSVVHGWNKFTKQPVKGSRPKFCIFSFLISLLELRNFLFMHKLKICSSSEMAVFFFLNLCPSGLINCRLPRTLLKNHSCSWTELLAINIVSIYILILAVWFFSQ